MYFLHIFILEWGVELDRFCDKCGSLVSGNGKFCPLCGAKMGFELNISSDLDVDTSSSFLDELDTALPDLEADVQENEKPHTSVKVPQAATAAPDIIYTNKSAQDHVPQGYVPQYIPQQSFSRVYQQNGNAQNGDVEKLTTSQWAGTIILSTCLAMISYILLIMWGFGNGSKEPRRSFARAMLILLPIFHILMFFGLAVLIEIVNS